MFTRLVLTLFGLACASAAALVFLPVAVLLDPLVQQAAGAAPAEHWLDALTRLAPDGDPERALAMLFQLIWTIGMLVCVLPVTLTALLGGVTGARSFAFYAGLAGVLAAAMPWILRAGRVMERGALLSTAEAHLTLILFLTGVVAGAVYWLIAAREPPRRGPGWMASQPRG